MKVALTGSGGFIGSHLLKALEESFGASQVTQVISTDPVGGNSDRVRRGVHIDAIASNEVMDVEYLIHAGAFTPKNKSQADSIDGSIENIIFTQKLVRAPWRRLRKIVYLSTIDVYGIADGVMTEETIPNPQSLYAYSKLFSERMVESFAKECNVDCQVVRVGHVYGPGEGQYQKLIPTAIRAILTNQEVRVRGDGSDRRSYVYVRDLVIGVLNLLKAPRSSGLINAVGTNPVSVLEVIQAISEATGRNAVIKRVDASSNSNEVVFQSNRFDLILEKPQTRFLEGIAEEIDYFEKSTEV